MHIFLFLGAGMLPINGSLLLNRLVFDNHRQLHETDFSDYYDPFTKEYDNKEDSEIFISEDLEIASVLNNKIFDECKEREVELTGLFPHNEVFIYNDHVVSCINNETIDEIPQPTISKSA
jgi:hypothetical protein